MAANWIKVRVDLERTPEVIRLARALGIEIPHAVGLLVRFWGWADEQTATGQLEGLTLDDVDAAIRMDGFGRAMAGVGWLLVDDIGLIVPNFERHMSQSAKRRALDAGRKRVRQ